MAGCVAGLLLLVFIINPATSSLGPCYFHELTGLSCPTCGMTRSLHAALHLDLAEAIRYHWMGIIFLVMLFLGMIKFSYEGMSGWRLQMVLERWQRRGIFLVVFLPWLVFWIARMIGELGGQNALFQVP